MRINKVIPDHARHALRHALHFLTNRLELGLLRSETFQLSLLKTEKYFMAFPDNKADLIKFLSQEQWSNKHLCITQNVQYHTSIYTSIYHTDVHV